MGLYAAVGTLQSGIGSPDAYADQAEYDDTVKMIAEEDRLVRSMVSSWSPNSELWRPDDRSIAGQHVGNYLVLHYLRRYACYLSIHGKVPPPVVDNDTDCLEVDQTVEALHAFYAGWNPKVDPQPIDSAPCRFPHLIWHSDCDGYYVPMDFLHPVFIPHNDGLCSIASSIKLLAELDDINRFLGVAKDYGYLTKGERKELMKNQEPYSLEKWFWSILHWLARESIAYNLPIIYC